MLLVVGATTFETVGTLSPAPRRPNGGGAPAPRVLRTGMGRASTLAALERVPQGTTGILNVGFAGALAAGVESGTPFLVSRVVRGGGEDHVDLDPVLRAWARAALPEGAALREGRLVSAGGAVSSPDEKRRLASLTGADLVDMEAFWIAHWAAITGLPLLILKVVLDTAAGELPRGARVLADARSLRPRDLPGLLGIAPAAFRARGVLVRTARRLVERWPLPVASDEGEAPDAEDGRWSGLQGDLR